MHQTSGKTNPTLTTQQEIPITDDQNSLKVGARGPTALEDFNFQEKIFHFDHERIPEHVVHARGFRAHGYFENYESLRDVTKADLFQRPGEKTPAFVRFFLPEPVIRAPSIWHEMSEVFSLKLYTKEGNWDLVGNNMPVFFIQNAIKFPDLIHAAKPKPDRGFPQAQTAHDNFLDFISLTPESMHMVSGSCPTGLSPPFLSLHGRVWRAYISADQWPGKVDVCEISLKTQIGDAIRGVERSRET